MPNQDLPKLLDYKLPCSLGREENYCHAIDWLSATASYYHALSNFIYYVNQYEKKLVEVKLVEREHPVFVEDLSDLAACALSYQLEMLFYLDEANEPSNLGMSRMLYQLESYLCGDILEVTDEA